MDFRGDQPKQDLGGEWRFCWTFERPAKMPTTIEQVEAMGLPIYPAKVPGNFELDLLANGLIDEPFHGMNIAKLRRYEHAHAWYFRTFEVTPVPDADPVLTFEGLDCFSEVRVNRGQCQIGGNMLVPHVGRLAAAQSRGTTHELVVPFESPAARRQANARTPHLLQHLPANYESLYERRAPHMYGWDIMPRALSMGIWRPVHLRWLPKERLTDCYLETQRVAEDRSSATLYLHYTALTKPGPDDEYEVRLEGACGDSRFEANQRCFYSAGAIRFDVRNPRLWWPRDRGPADLYDVRLSLLKNGEEIDRLTFTHGIRTITLERTSVTDEHGSGQFLFRVNGEKLFVKGTNWVPLDAYHSRDIERVDAAMDLVTDIGCKMIWCWGGNVYESDRFFDLCDRAGVLVWQDFAMACGIYPQDDMFAGTMRHEVERVVRRLRQHACVAMWAGDNECDQSYLWGGSGVDPNTNVLTRKVIPEVLRQHDPIRPYLPSSPYIDPEAYRKGVKYLPEDHLWGPRDYYKSAFYQESLCHFASEIGYHGCPSPESIRKFISPGKVWPYQDNEEWLLHCTSPIPSVNLYDYRVELMASQVRVLFGDVPDNLEDFAFASQASQAEAKKFFIEMFRTQKWRRTGIIWWNILDGWPQFSDAVADYYFSKKVAYHFVKRAQAPLLVALREPGDGMRDLVLCNDTRDALETSYAVHDSETGAEVCRGTAIAEPDAVTLVSQLPAEDARKVLVLEWTSPLGPGLSHYLTGKPPYSLGWYRERIVGLFGE